MLKAACLILVDQVPEEGVLTQQNRLTGALVSERLDRTKLGSLSLKRDGRSAIKGLAGKARNPKVAVLRNIISYVRREAVLGRVPEGRRLYAVGDIHGRLDLLEHLLARIDNDSLERGGRESELIFLGDLIDRGPHSARVVERLLALKRERPSTRFIMGNHEEVFLDVLRGSRQALRFFSRIGGRETVLSYGISQREYSDANWDELAALLASSVPRSHREFIAAFEDMVVAGDYAFVHAGVRPGVKIADQQARDLRWIRDEFLNYTGRLEKVVVHGHSVSGKIVTGSHRVSLDTGAYFSGVLTAMGFEGSRRWLIQVDGGG